MNPAGRRKIHYAWFVLAGCCILQGANLGLIHNCAGVFYSVVCDDLGFEVGRFTFYRMLYSLSSAVTMPFVAKSFRRTDVRISLSAAAVVYGLCSIAMGTFSELWQWYLTGIVQGMASAFLCFVSVPILLTNWFYKKTGTAVGISAAFSGLIGMFGSSGLGAAIPAFGWRISYMLIGAVSICLTLPMTLFVLRYKPEDKGMSAYGAEEETAGAKAEVSAAGEALTAANREPAATVRTAAAPDDSQGGFRDIARQPAFYIALSAYACAFASSHLNSFLTACGQAAGLPLTAAAMMTTLALCGNTVSKLFLGKASDSFGVIRVMLVSTLIAVLGHVLLFTGFSSGMMAGALLFGVTPPLTTVMMPLLCRLSWKGDAYSVAYSYVSMFGTLLAAPFDTLFGVFYDWTGTYHLTIFVSAFLLAIVLALVRLQSGMLAGKAKNA